VEKFLSFNIPTAAEQIIKRVLFELIL